MAKCPRKDGERWSVPECGGRCRWSSSAFFLLYLECVPKNECCRSSSGVTREKEHGLGLLTGAILSDFPRGLQGEKIVPCSCFVEEVRVGLHHGIGDEEELLGQNGH